ncbi:DUF3027 domain-containing protein [Agromyces aurantiacus]|uniref:DUF3027 domain-containing protein n=1 Tax=Agromyces aurantiacus TaxID=165814 RepID=A0ABV9R4C6_9MICO|nr:DUF3027 domain-containing protein [Agromyces aurantiacus]MBM7505513.1 hypothetical protein [Agromyces aurantiacus]
MPDVPEPVEALAEPAVADEASAGPAAVDESPGEDSPAEPAVADEAPAEPAVADEVLLASVDLAQRALLEVTAPETVGSVIGHVVEGEHVLSLHFAADLSGYPGWHWSVTLARVEGGEPTVLETELMPGARALLAPEWVPWSDRLAEYRAAQAAAAAEAREAGEPGDEDEVEGPAEEGEDAEGELEGDEFDDDADDFDADELGEEFGDAGADGDDAFDGIDIDSLDEEE